MGCPDGEERLHLSHPDRVFQATWNQDESLILTSSGGEVRVWDAETGELRLRLSHGVTVTQAKWNKAGNLILTGDGNGVARVWMWRQGKSDYV